MPHENEYIKYKGRLNFKGEYFHIAPHPDENLQMRNYFPIIRFLHGVYDLRLYIFVKLKKIRIIIINFKFNNNTNNNNNKKNEIKKEQKIK
jgi:hypothetical protein